MFNTALADRRAVNKTKLYETMGRTELAANLFRITQTEERIKNQNIQGQNKLQDAHFEVGREVRNMIIKNVGTEPENLPQEKRLRKLKRNFLKKIQIKRKTSRISFLSAGVNLAQLQELGLKLIN